MSSFSVVNIFSKYLFLQVIWHMCILSPPKEGKFLYLTQLDKYQYIKAEILKYYLKFIFWPHTYFSHCRVKTNKNCVPILLEGTAYRM